MSDRGLDEVRDAAADLIRQTISLNWLYGTAEPKVAVGLSPASGGSGAFILRAKVGVSLFAKFHPHDVQREAAGYELLRKGPIAFTQHMVPPLPTDDGPVFWLTPHLDASTLHEVVCSRRPAGPSDEFLFRLYDDYLSAEESLWRATSSGSQANTYETYENRVSGDRFAALEAVIRYVLDEPTLDLGSATLKVNKHPGHRVADILSNFHSRVGETPQPIGCTIHGDDHAKNIMLFRDAYTRDAPHRWVIVDYVSALSNADWVFAAAKMIQWWDFYCVLEMAKSNRRLRNALKAGIALEPGSNTITITYDHTYLNQKVPPICRNLRQMVLDRCQIIAPDHDKFGAQWRERLDLALFSVVFGSAHRQVGEAAFALPIMLAKSLDYLFGGVSQ